MKNPIRKTTVIGTSVLLAFFAISCSKESVLPAEEAFLSQKAVKKSALVNDLQSTISEDERHSLLFMREEEKLARDVYITLYKKWGDAIFSNISESEQSHMDAILKLLVKYNLPDPAANNPIGVFTDESLQSLYNQLVAKGSTSLMNALIVGATIEDMDLRDIKEDLQTIDNSDIIEVYENLLKGSRNHLRSFYSKILDLGGTYTPQYITQEEFEEVVSSEMETGS
ncbi:DUF2202 domain-containing protein [Flavihumibacter stibioxidans]|uniref:DUF2202 domain-containing protein n=1 Tax=Flavihumibacter stibioxidans TaxID=1834163 RepID=UPI00164F31E7|nr:DUF2202 domain-containing protein [Flavihumibacter stibioxidans]